MLDRKPPTTKDLAARAGVKETTVRSWVTKGILPKPGEGRNATYPVEAYDRVDVAQKLQRLGWTLDDVAGLFARLHVRQVEDLAATISESDPKPGSLWSRIVKERPKKQKTKSVGTHALGHSKEEAFDELLSKLRFLTNESSPERVTATGIWLLKISDRIDILAYNMTSSELRKLEQIADFLRHNLKDTGEVEYRLGQTGAIYADRTSPRSESSEHG